MVQINGVRAHDLPLVVKVTGVRLRTVLYHTGEKPCCKKRTETILYTCVCLIREQEHNFNYS